MNAGRGNVPAQSRKVSLERQPRIFAFKIHTSVEKLCKLLNRLAEEDKMLPLVNIYPSDWTFAFST